MTAYGSDEAIERLEAAWTCEHLACMRAREQRNLARDCAAALEAENAALRVLIHVANYKRAESGVNYTDEDDWIAQGGLLDFIEDGRIGPGALALVSRLSGGEG